MKIKKIIRGEEKICNSGTNRHGYEQFQKKINKIARNFDKKRRFYAFLSRF